MEKKYINRFHSFENSLESLKKLDGRDISDEFVMSGAVQIFSLTFDISWKVMKDILVHYHRLSDFATGSPRETLRKAYQAKLIHDDVWMQMLDDRNDLTHDYDGTLAGEAVVKIRDVYIPVFEEFRAQAAEYMQLMEKEDD